MDFIKVLNRHTLFEYTDLLDSEFVAWIKIMSLTAYLEKEPTREQMLKEVHHKTLDSLQEKLKTHAISLQDILKKVLKDAQSVNIRREEWKKRKQRSRDLNKIVTQDVTQDVPHKEKEKEIDIEKDIIPPIVPQGGQREKKVSVFKKPTLDEVALYCLDRKNGIIASEFWDHYEANGWRVGKTPMKDWKAAVRTWEQKRKGGEFNVRSKANFGFEKRQSVQTKTDAEVDEITRRYLARQATGDKATGVPEADDVPDFPMPRDRA
jgi:hypothetical protein